MLSTWKLVKDGDGVGRNFWYRRLLQLGREVRNTFSWWSGSKSKYVRDRRSSEILQESSRKMKCIIFKCVFSFGNTAHLFFLPKIQLNSTELLKLELGSKNSSLCSSIETWKIIYTPHLILWKDSTRFCKIYSSLLRYFINKDVLKFLENNHDQIVFHIPRKKVLLFPAVSNASCLTILFLFMQYSPKFCMANVDLNAGAQDVTLASFK